VNGRWRCVWATLCTVCMGHPVYSVYGPPCVQCVWATLCTVCMGHGVCCVSRIPNLLHQFVLDLQSGKLHREFHNGPDPAIGQVSSSSSGGSTSK